ncbi:Tor complex Tor2 interacting protein 1 [Asimina triloba]
MQILFSIEANSGFSCVIMMPRARKKFLLFSANALIKVIDALNAEGPDIDIILTEIDLPISKGLKMLKYIMRNKELRRIPIVMMSSQDEVSVVVKCLRLGAADFLVKPLRTNELLTLWTHMWRRRRMLGLSEKNILSCEFDLVASDPSDANTNSTTLFSDETDEKLRQNTVPEMSMSNHPEHEHICKEKRPDLCSAVYLGTGNGIAHIGGSFKEKYSLNVSASIEPPLRGISSPPKKSELKVGECSAFFTYVKSRALANNHLIFGSMDENTSQSKELSTKEMPPPSSMIKSDAERPNGREEWGKYSLVNSLPCGDGYLITNAAERPSTVPLPLGYPQGWNLSLERLSASCLHPSSDNKVEVSSIQPLTHLPIYMPGMMNQVMMPSPGQLFSGNLHDTPKHDTSAMLPQYNSLPQCFHVPMMAPFSYYSGNENLRPGQMPSPYVWQSIGSSSSSEVKSIRVERREAALKKFKQKRKDRCFDKKIRYINRKRLAEKRPRVRGQFVRQVNDVDIDSNIQAVDDSDNDGEEYEDDEEEASEN